VSINLTIFPVEAPAKIYFEDGTSMRVEAQQEKSLQVPSGTSCTIQEDDEHPISEEDAIAFAERMVATWNRIVDKLRTEALAPTATPQ